MNVHLTRSPEVEEAAKHGKPIVALESTIISHGMPYPQNVATAREVEQIIRENGAVPATIAILDGKIKIGLTDEELEELGSRNDIAKASRKDIPYLVATKKPGATTVAATMICAELAGIQIFVTGGIGGVHREGETTMDISADLEELAHTNVGVVCAGAKSILDLGLTLEYLETKGVPVMGYQTQTLPAFFTRTSPFAVHYQVNAPSEIASILKAKWELEINGGAVIANPIPEEYAMDEQFINGVIDSAIAKAKSLNIEGKDVTPFLLDQVNQATEGKSLAANIQLVKSNARLGAQIAVHYAKQTLLI
ncbi:MULTISPECIES: pseudouridine-5'-phosphate glycosidase [Pontibacillus]|uniref:Pseudouridine-5'-phosphate glycosidase n=1 Tax=Pontibacillus chungwhensis TaxID=265426 RepID=A0ABY8UZY1_9BACI|nr:MULTISPECIES: pseudouridine-5'-phosphate glycosidase [Pontibacillus]MCD5325655.1 pseudouridine-5'-phosphate glycosidase [Pontibacillus sp. HN14]WIF98099.1 pseudouridine-5'-phosphate glycosidase [Pontibacillus chungwhensis]